MRRYILRRALVAIPMVMLVSVVVFAALHLAPGGPTGAISANPKATGEDIARIEKNFGLDRPPPVQYLLWFRQVFLRLDFGKSYVTGRPVRDMILERLPATLELMGTAFVVAFAAGLLLGVLSSLTKNGAADQIFSALSAVGLSVPVFWLGLVAVYAFSLRLGWLPAGGRGDTGPDHLKHLLLPASVLAFAYLASWSRYLRAGLAEATNGAYIRTARAKGLGDCTIIGKHALRNALPPMLAVVFMQIPTMFTGAVITETVFSWPGMGRLFYEGMVRQDYTRVMGIVIVSSLLIIICNLLGDLVGAAIDPRMEPGASATGVPAGGRRGIGGGSGKA